MISISYETSILPRKCQWCGKWIRPRTKFVEFYCFFMNLPELDTIFRFCDPHCARCFHEHEMGKSRKEDQLRKIVLGEDA